jgi:hypothetical protein
MRQRLAVIGRRGGLTTAARSGPSNLAARARSGFLSKFEREVDPEGVLPAAERAARAKLAMRAHMSRLASKRWS